jgi:hypothetical protein
VHHEKWSLAKKLAEPESRFNASFRRLAHTKAPFLAKLRRARKKFSAASCRNSAADFFLPGKALAELSKKTRLAK